MCVAIFDCNVIWHLKFGGQRIVSLLEYFDFDRSDKRKTSARVKQAWGQLH